ncbi:hypothetical protein SBRCBS47491_008217 [Sporothrix bragantina]|uniref:Uncharacterized protein n=1 Tax=Sporothrix bragantina TaxID=671064 RepID=A0ABP0CJM3_9PEZI
MSQTLALNRALTLTLDTGVNSDYFAPTTFEWYTERGGMQYSESTASESEDDSNSYFAQDYTHDFRFDKGTGNGQLGEATYATNDSTYVYAYRPWPQSSTDEQTAEEDDDDEDATPSTATIDTNTQIVYQTNNDLSYYGYGDYDFAQLSRTTTAYSVPSTEAKEGSEAEEHEYEGEDEEDEDDGLEMAQRRWHCPRLER